MSCGKCGKSGGHTRLCPVSFGLAVGLTCGLAVLIGSLCAGYFGNTGMMAAYHMPALGLKDAGILSLFVLFKGFIFGFFIALFYDLIVCCCKCKSRCCGKSDGADKCCAPTEKSSDAGK